MISDLTGKVALVTGGTTGIGRAIVEHFLEQGAKVVSFARGQTKMNDHDRWGDSLTTFTGDVRSADDNRRAVETAIDRYGRLDIFVGNAGVYDNRRPFSSFTLSDLDSAFDELFAINVKGYMLGALAALDALTGTRGCIIFTSSISGMHPGFGGALYVAAKHAINGLTKQLALELAPHVRVNAVAPGYVPTQLRGLESLAQTQGGSGPKAADMPLQTIGLPADYATAYSFLASDAGARIATGTIISLDGGTSLRGPGPFRNRDAAVD